MTCDQMRGALLSADLEELRGIGTGEVADHLRGCPACRADAERILEATARLGSALRIRRRSRVIAWATPLALAAGIALLILGGPQVVVVPPVGGPATAPPAAAGAPADLVPPAGRVVRATTPQARPLPRSTPVDAMPIRAVAYATSSIAATPLRPTPPSSTRHPKELHPADPDITVLWFE